MTKAFLLGAGLGTRLRPLTDALPKPLIPVFHRPLITYALDHCLGAGIREFAINTHHLPGEWEGVFRDPALDGDPAPRPQGSYHHAPLTFFHEPELLETGGGLKNLEPWIDNDPLLVYNGDILAGISLDRLIATHLASGNTVTLGLRSHGPGLHVAFDGTRVLDIRRFLDTADGSHQFIGIYCLSPELLRLIPPNEKISIIPAFLDLAREGALGGCLLDDGPWLDLGTRDSYLAAHFESPLEGADRPPLIHPEARIDPSAAVAHSAIGPGSLIGPGAVIRDSIIWPNQTIAPQARLTNCIVYSSTPVSGTHQNADL